MKNCFTFEVQTHHKTNEATNSQILFQSERFGNAQYLNASHCGVFAADWIFLFSTNNKMQTHRNPTASFNLGIENATRKFTQQRDLVKTAERITFLKRNFISSPSFRFLSKQEQIEFLSDIEQTAQFLINLFTENPIIPERSTLS